MNSSSIILVLFVHVLYFILWNPLFSVILFAYIPFFPMTVSVIQMNVWVCECGVASEVLPRWYVCQSSRVPLFVSSVVLQRAEHAGCEVAIRLTGSHFSCSLLTVANTERRPTSQREKENVCRCRLRYADGVVAALGVTSAGASMINNVFRYQGRKGASYPELRAHLVFSLRLASVFQIRFSIVGAWLPLDVTAWHDSEWHPACQKSACMNIHGEISVISAYRFPSKSRHQLVSAGRSWAGVRECAPAVLFLADYMYCSWS